jgi:hypothetical protein
MTTRELNQILKSYLEARFKSPLDFFTIEGQMSPDPEGYFGVTGTLRKRAGDKSVYFTATVNLRSGIVQNLQEY